MDFKIPEKQAFKIGEVCEMMDLPPYVLRFWESQFEDLNPPKNPMNQRVYRPKDIQIVYLIKKLLYQEGYTIEGARKQLKKEIARADKEPGQWNRQDFLQGLRNIRIELQQILTILKE
jgi:DNA-binding transcriptional MerR regulator